MDLLAPKPQTPREIKERYCSWVYPRPERVLFRYEIVVRNYDNEGVTSNIFREVYAIIGETKHSWFFDDHGRKRRVLKGGGKRFAYLSDEDALLSLRKRTRWRMSHAHWAMTQAHEAIDIYNEIFPSEKPLMKVGTL